MMKHFVWTLLIFLPLVASARFEFEEDEALPIVYFNIVVDTGSAHDPKGKEGLAYLANQMLLRGTQNHGKIEFFEALSQLGGEFEVDVRGEGTVFRGAVLSENLEPFLNLVAEALTSPRFRAEELAKLKKETESAILEEKGSDKNLVAKHFSDFFYGDHPYANPIRGRLKSLKQISSKDLIHFYTQAFGAETLHFFGSGFAKTETLERWHRALIEKMAALHPDAAKGAPIAKIEFPSGRRTLLVNKPKSTQAQILLGGKGMRPETEGFYAVLIANHIFGGTSLRSTLMQELRGKRGWTYGAYNIFKFGEQPRHFTIYYFPKTEDAAAATTLAIDLFEDLYKNGITREQFDFARQSMVNKAPFDFDTSRKRLEAKTAEYLLNFPSGYHKEMASNLKRVGYDDVLPAIKNIFNPESLTLVVVGDAEKLEKPLSKLSRFSEMTTKNHLDE